MKLLAAALGLAVISSAVMAQQKPSSPSGRSVGSLNQTGGITAWTYNNNTIVNRIPKADPISARLVAAMANYRDARMGAAIAAMTVDEEHTATYIYLLDQTWPGAGDDKVLSYEVGAMKSDDYEDDFGGLKNICSDEDGAALIGTLQTIELKSGKVEYRPLGAADHALFEPLCRSLGRPLSSLTGSPASKDEMSLVEFYAMGRVAFTFQFISGRLFGNNYEATVGRYFWVPAMQARYVRFPQKSDLADSPESVEAVTSVLGGKAATFSNPPSIPLGQGYDAYPTSARSEFGKRLEVFDADWVRYLAAGQVTIRGRQISGFATGPRSARLPRTSPRDLGSNAFLRGANDVNHLNEMTACLAGRFLSAKGYQVKESPDELGRCTVSRR
jgi:hypothetical protein